MTHEELDWIGPELEKRCNNEIAKRWPTWSRYVKGRMLNELMDELAPDWSWHHIGMINAPPQIALSEYMGPVEDGR